MVRDPFLAKRAALRERRRERRRSMIRWSVLVVLVGLHVGVYFYADEIVNFIKGGRDAVVEHIGKNTD